MGYWETFLYKEVAKHFMEHHLYFIQNCKRYLDDCLILWPGTEEDMDKLKSIINNILFSSESSQTELPLLDILIKKETRVQQLKQTFIINQLTLNNIFYLIPATLNIKNQCTL